MTPKKLTMTAFGPYLDETVIDFERFSRKFIGLHYSRNHCWQFFGVGGVAF